MGLIGNAIASYGWPSIGSLGTYALGIYIGLALVLLVVYPAIFVAQFFGVPLGFTDYLLLAIDPILDMGRTAVNVAGQALVPTVVAKREGVLDLQKYSSANSADLLSDDQSEGITKEAVGVR